MARKAFTISSLTLKNEMSEKKDLEQLKISQALKDMKRRITVRLQRQILLAVEINCQIFNHFVERECLRIGAHTRYFSSS